MKEVTLQNVGELQTLVGAINETQLAGAVFYFSCPNHKHVHAFPAHRERCNIALRNMLREHGIYANGDATA